MGYISNEDFERAKLEEYNRSMEAHKKYFNLIQTTGAVLGGLGGLVVGHCCFDNSSTLPEYVGLGIGTFCGFLLGMQVLDDWQTDAERKRDTDKEGRFPAKYMFR